MILMTIALSLWLVFKLYGWVVDTSERRRRANEIIERAGWQPLERTWTYNAERLLRNRSEDPNDWFNEP